MNAAPRKIILGFSLLILILFIGGGIWYAGRFETQPISQPLPSLKPFSEKDQVVPKGTLSQSMSSTLRMFNFPQPLPFFDEHNVVQSLDLHSNMATPISVPSLKSSTATLSSVAGADSHESPDTITQKNTPSPFLSYRIIGQNKVEAQSVFIGYFKNIGWEMAHTFDKQSLIFFSPAHKIVSVTFLDVPHGGTDQSAIIVALSMQ